MNNCKNLQDNHDNVHNNVAIDDTNTISCDVEDIDEIDKFIKELRRDRIY